MYIEANEIGLINTLVELLNHPTLASGIIIAWAQGGLAKLQASKDERLYTFAQGVEAWLDGNHVGAATAWQHCRGMGLDGSGMGQLLELVNAADPPTPTVAVYVDASFTPREGGAACVWQRDGTIGFLVRYLPGPLPDNHYAEAQALFLALTAPELENSQLILYTDSSTVMHALEAPAKINLPSQTLGIIAKVKQLSQEREADIIFRRSRTGQLLHDKADHLAGWIRTLGALPELIEKGINNG